MRRSGGRVFAVRLATAAFAALLGLVAARASAQATSAPVVATTAPADADKVACAVLPTVLSAAPDHPLLSLVEQELLKGGRYRVVDRQHLGAVLNEQLLQAAVGAEGVRARQDVGKVVRADLLVLIGAPERAAQADGARQPVTTQPAAAKGAVTTQRASAKTAAGTTLAVGDTQPYVPVVIAETKQGLRLLNAKLPWDEKNAEATAAEIAGMVENARQTLAGGIRAVFAVPPFESEDLSFKYEYLMAAYAAVVAQAVTRQPGVVIVELAEAQALGRELAVSPGPSTVSRGLPYYVMGRYKHAGMGAERTVGVHVELRQGETVLATVEESDVATAAVGATLQKAANQFLKGALADGGVALARPEVAQEADLLRKRGAEFARLGNWSEALSLYEASLLLEPDRAEAHFQAVALLTELLQTLTMDPRDVDAYVRNGLRRLALYRLGLEHVEHFFRLMDPVTDPVRVSNWFWRFRDRANWFPGLEDLRARAKAVEELPSAIRSVARYEREVVRAIMLNRHTTGIPTLEIVELFIPALARSAADKDEPLDVTLARYLEVIRLIPDMRGNRDDELIQQIALLSIGPRWYGRPEYAAFLDQLAALPGENVRLALKEVRAKIAREQEMTSGQRAPVSTSAPAEPPGVTLHRLMPVDLGLPADARLDRDPHVIALSPGLDLMEHDTKLYLVEGRGRARRIFVSQAVAIEPELTCWDGAFVWTPVFGKEHSLAILDPVHELVWRFGEKDGLLPRSGLYPMTPVGPGQVCVVGHLGEHGAVRNWLGIVDFSAKSGRIVVDVLREFRAQLDLPRQSGGGPVAEDVALGASFMVTLTDPDDVTQKRVLINQEVRSLLVDPSRRTVEVLGGFGPTWKNVAVRSDCVYLVGSRTGSPARSVVVRVGFPSFRAVEVASIPEYAIAGPFFFDGERVNALGFAWWRAPSIEGTFVGLRVDRKLGWPHDWTVWPTSNYGPLITIGGNNGVYEAEFPEPASRPRGPSGE